MNANVHESLLSSILRLSFLALVACEKQPPPLALRVELPEAVLSSDPAKVIVHVRTADGSERTNEKDNEYTVEPAGVARVDPRGLLTCLKSEDATVTASLRGVSHQARVKCRLVEKISVPDLGQRDITGGPIALTVQATTKDGKALTDVPVMLTTPNSRVVRVSGSEILPLSVGHAEIHARAGEATATFGVDIVRALKPDPVSLDDGKRIHISVPEGKYELTVELGSERTLAMEWRGAPYCNYEGMARIHRRSCVMRTKGAVVFDNPAALESDSREVSLKGITLAEVP